MAKRRRTLLARCGPLALALARAAGPPADEEVCVTAIKFDTVIVTSINSIIVISIIISFSIIVISIIISIIIIVMITTRKRRRAPCSWTWRPRVVLGEGQMGSGLMGSLRIRVF